MTLKIIGSNSILRFLAVIKIIDLLIDVWVDENATAFMQNSDYILNGVEMYNDYNNVVGVNVEQVVVNHNNFNDHEKNLNQDSYTWNIIQQVRQSQ